MPEKLKDTEKWTPDFGPVGRIHPTAGVTAIGARMPLVAFNVNLNTPDVEIANKIAKRIRHLSGGYRFIKSIGVGLSDRHVAQVSMNLVNYQKTAMYRAFEAIKMEAKRYGVVPVESEIVGLLPMEALVDTACYYLQVTEDFDMDKQVMESRLLEGEE
jgi:glutamate formiminotransferase